MTVRLAYYPPYHSKYNPIEHGWGALEQHWNGTLLDELDTVMRFAESMTWRGKHPVIKLVTTLYGNRSVSQPFCTTEAQRPQSSGGFQV